MTPNAGVNLPLKATDRMGTEPAHPTSYEMRESQGGQLVAHADCWNHLGIEMKLRYCETSSVRECFSEVYMENPGSINLGCVVSITRTVERQEVTGAGDNGF